MKRHYHVVCNGWLHSCAVDKLAKKRGVGWGKARASGRRDGKDRHLALLVFEIDVVKSMFRLLWVNDSTFELNACVAKKKRGEV